MRDETGAVVDLVFDYANRGAGAVAGMAGERAGRACACSRCCRPSRPRCSRASSPCSTTALPLRTELDYSDRFAGARAFSTRFEISASRLGDGLLVVYEDVAARARAQATERRYGAVLEATSDWVSIADRDNNLVYVNPAGRRMVGIGLDEDITGRRIGEFSPAWARERVLGEALQVARRDGSGAAISRGCIATATRSRSRRSSSRAWPPTARSTSTRRSPAT